jgi:aryl-alcohol dehydrogenase-like predicted oxidoreductase
MEYRSLGRTGWNVSTIGFGAWAIGGSWGDVDDRESMATLHRAVELGINFFDTADVYGDGHSERLIAQLYRDHGDGIIVATKAGRRLNPHVAAGYTSENLTAFVDRSLRNLGRDALDLLQLHCPPPDAYYMPEIFSALDALRDSGKIRFYGVSVERVEEALKAIEYPDVQSVQIIFNIFRQRPADHFFAMAQERRVGILARVPLASGLLTGKMSRSTTFAADDHRRFNRDGSAFDVGETFSGVDFETGLHAVEQLKEVCPSDHTLAQFALKWILMHEAVSCAIPGARRPSQVDDNVHAADLPALTSEQMASVKQIYEGRIKSYVHHRW